MKACLAFKEEDVLCAQKVKLCPDDIFYVDRESPNCKFTSTKRRIQK